MKVLSATDSRPRDLEDIRAILRANPSLDESKVTDLLQKSSTRGYSRGQSLEQKWQTLKSRFTQKQGY
jgi:hypothetical protein